MSIPRNCVKEFHKVFNHPVRTGFTFDPVEADLRYKLIEEEVNELGAAYDASDLVEIADALGDITYVVYGAAWTFGIAALTEFASVQGAELISYELGENPMLNEEGRERWLNLLQKSLSSGSSLNIMSVLANILIAVKDAAKSLDIPLDEVVQAIHKSNMTKLGDDGRPIYRAEDNKVLKGPKYQTPTEDIKKLLGL